MLHNPAARDRPVSGSSSDGGTSAVGMVRFLGAPFDDREFDFDERRGRFGLIVAIDLGRMVFSHSMASF